MSFLAGILGGLGESLGQHQQNLLAIELEKRKQLRELYEKLALSQDVIPEGRQEFMRRALDIQMLPIGKKIPKDYQDVLGILSVSPQQGVSWPGPVQTIPFAAWEIPADLEGLERRPATPSETTGPFPAPPPGYKRSVFYSPDELLDRQIRALTGTERVRAGIGLETEIEKERLTHEARRREGERLGLKGHRLAEYVSGRPLTPEIRPMSPSTETGSAIRAELDADASGNPIDEDASYRVIRDLYSGSIISATRLLPQVRSRQWRRDPTSTSEWALDQFDQQGKLVGSVQGLEPPVGYLPSVSESVRTQLVPLPTGQTVAVEVPSSTKRFRAPTAGREFAGPIPKQARPVRSPIPQGTRPVPPPRGKEMTSPEEIESLTKPVSPGQIVGGKALTPFQRQRLESASGGFESAFEILPRIYDNLLLLKSMFAAGKINLAIDPDQSMAQATFIRGIPFSPQEDKLAADLQSMMEHINLLRAPLGATGFRSIQAWNALQAMKANPLQRPEVIRGVLENTMTAMVLQKASIDRALAGPGETPILDNGTAALLLRITHGDKVRATVLAQKHGYGPPPK